MVIKEFRQGYILGETYSTVNRQTCQISMVYKVGYGLHIIYHKATELLLYGVKEIFLIIF